MDGALVGIHSYVNLGISIHNHYDFMSPGVPPARNFRMAMHSGEITEPVTSGIYRAADSAGTLGEVVIGKKKRVGPDTITIFDSTGLAIQDWPLQRSRCSTGGRLSCRFPDTMIRVAR